jgi:Flp pilus assembly pilin Flp
MKWSNLQSEAGQTNTEYGFVLVIFSIALIGLLVFVAGNVTDFYENVAELVRWAFTSSTGQTP